MGARFSKSTPATAVPVAVGALVARPAEATPDEPAPPKKALEPAPAKQALDLVFTMDCTGSMGSYIHAAKKNIEAIVERLVRSEGYDLRFGLVAYRDHPPQDQTYVTREFAFTDAVEQMRRNLAALSAQGGGDGPEAVAAGLKATLECQWRPAATKVCVLIADAPPHGLGEPGDGFPDGAPDGVDPFEVLTRMSMAGVCIYSVGCEPALSRYQYAKDFFVAAATKTNGQAVSLRSAAALADVIMGGAIEEMDLQQLADEVVQEVKRNREARADLAAADGYDSEEERATAWASLQTRGYNTRHMQTKKLKSKNAASIATVASLSSARETLKSLTPGSPRRGSMKCKKAAPRARERGERTSRSTIFGTGADRSISAAGMTDVRLERRTSGGSWEGEGSDSEDDSIEADCSSPGGVRLETRALSFTQMSRIYGKQKKMGLI